MSDGLTWPRRALRAFRRTVFASFLLGLVVAAVPPLREAVLFGATAAVLRVSDRWAPNVPPFADLSADSKIVASDGRLLATLEQENRRPLRLADVPVRVRRAVLAAEDADFYRHPRRRPPGARPGGVAQRRAAVTEGGSTITQQLAKLNSPPAAADVAPQARRGRSHRRARASATAKMSSCERYLNQVYFGDEGLRASPPPPTPSSASTRPELSPAQAATLAGKIRSPDRLDPRLDPEAVVRRRNAGSAGHGRGTAG